MGNLSYKTLRENVVDEIRKKILKQEYPPGTRIIEQNLSDEFGISRGPIREALRQLEQEGLVEYSRNVGCSVKQISIEDVYEIYLLRSTYEILSVKLCSGRFTQEEMNRMENVLELMKNLSEEETDREKIIRYDHMLHRIIVEKSGLARLCKSWEDLNYGSNIAVNNSGSYKKTLASHQYVIHRELLNVFQSGTPDEIYHAISNHYMLSVKKVMKEQNIDDSRFKFSQDIVIDI